MSLNTFISHLKTWAYLLWLCRDPLSQLVVGLLCVVFMKLSTTYDTVTLQVQYIRLYAYTQLYCRKMSVVCMSVRHTPASCLNG